MMINATVPTAIPAIKIAFDSFVSILALVGTTGVIVGMVGCTVLICGVMVSAEMEMTVII